MDSDKVITECKLSMQKAMSYLGKEYSGLRTGKASPALIEGVDVKVSSYGSTMKLKQLALISSPEPRQLFVQPFDPSVTDDIERALRESRLGLNPGKEGKNLRIPIPELSEERRRDLARAAKQMAEEAKVSVRSARREALEIFKKAQKDSEISEDDLRLYEKDVQNLTDKFTSEVNEQAKNKEADIMQM